MITKALTAWVILYRLLIYGNAKDAVLYYRVSRPVGVRGDLGACPTIETYKGSLMVISAL
jgi:hypothetical protein